MIVYKILYCVSSRFEKKDVERIRKWRILYREIGREMNVLEFVRYVVRVSDFKGILKERKWTTPLRVIGRS